MSAKMVMNSEADVVQLNGILASLNLITSLVQDSKAALHSNFKSLQVWRKLMLASEVAVEQMKCIFTTGNVIYCFLSMINYYICTYVYIHYVHWLPTATRLTI